MKSVAPLVIRLKFARDNACQFWQRDGEMMSLADLENKYNRLWEEGI
jgi:hypothetical protein